MYGILFHKWYENCMDLKGHFNQMLYCPFQVSDASGYILAFGFVALSLESSTCNILRYCMQLVVLQLCFLMEFFIYIM